VIPCSRRAVDDAIREKTAFPERPISPAFGRMICRLRCRNNAADVMERDERRVEAEASR
jgi:hypothetical protein